MNIPVPTQASREVGARAPVSVLAGSGGFSLVDAALSFLVMIGFGLTVWFLFQAHLS